MPSLSEDLAFRGLVHQVSDPALWPLLDKGQLSAYAGFDPTADSLHVGHLLGIVMLRRLQDAGNRPILVAGGGTGMVGDPGGKSEERRLLSVDQLKAHLVGVRSQLERFLDMSPSAGDAAGLLVDNSDWLSELGYLDFLRDVGKHFTVNQMVAKESVKARIERPEQGISYTEFSYMLLQAYDYLHLYESLGCRLQLGGSDQWGNITMGLELIRKMHAGEAADDAYALTWPLLLREDGSKFGKTEAGAIWLDPARTSPYALYQYFVRVPDTEVGVQLRYFTFLSHDEILELEESTARHPERRDAQRALAREVCAFVHGAPETARAESAAKALYSEDVATLDEDLLLAVFADAPSSVLARSSLDGGGLDLVDVLAASGLVASKSAARSAIGQGGAYVNNRRRGEDEARLTIADLVRGRYVVLRRGRRDYHLLRFE